MKKEREEDFEANLTGEEARVETPQNPDGLNVYEKAS